MTTYRTYTTGMLAALFVLAAGLVVALAPSEAHAQANTIEVQIDKKFSGTDEGFEEEQFSFHVEGNGVDEIVPHEGTIDLAPGNYTVTEIVPNGFNPEDWTIQWSGIRGICVNETAPSGTMEITADDIEDLEQTGARCVADNQFKPGEGGGGDDDDDDDNNGTTTDPETGGVEGTKYDEVTEDPIPGWMIYLYDGQSLVMSTTTDENGMYTFGDVEPGDYLVCEEMQDMWKQVTPDDGTGCSNGTFGHEVTVTEGSVTDAHDFWNIHDPVIIIDKVTSPNSSDIEFEFELSWSSTTEMLADTDEPWNSGDLSDIMDTENPFSVTEINIPEGWTLATVSCVSNLGHTETAESIDLNPGEIVTCTFTNRADDDNGGGGQCVDEAPGWADSVDGSNQAKKNNGNDIVDPERLDPGNALGAADWTEGSGTGFFSLGFGGWITVLFDKFVPDVDGDDISIHEATNDDEYPEETATVEVSQDGSNWFAVGTSSNQDNVSTRVSYFDFASTGLPWIKYVRVTDTTDGELHDEEADGFDLDAVDATEELCEEPDGGGDNGGGDNPGYSQGSYGGGSGNRVELREGGGGSSNDDDDEPESEVLGEQVSAVPAGAPNTGAGGAAPSVPSTLPMAFAFLSALLALGTLRVTREHA